MKIKTKMFFVLLLTITILSAILLSTKKDGIQTSANIDNENTENKTPFDVIDETLYGENKLTNTTDKIMWVVNNFENTQKHLE